MVTKAQAREIVAMCFSGTPLLAQSEKLGISYSAVASAVLKMRSAGIDVPTPDNAPVAKSKRMRRTEQDERMYKILHLRRQGLTMLQLAKQFGVSAPRIQQLLRSYAAKGHAVPDVEEAHAVTRAIRKERMRREREFAKLQRDAEKEALLMRSLGLSP